MPLAGIQNMTAHVDRINCTFDQEESCDFIQRSESVRFDWSLIPKDFMEDAHANTYVTRGVY